MRKHRYCVARVNGDPSDTHASCAAHCNGMYCPRGECECPDDEALDRAVDLAMPDKGDTVAYGYVWATDAGSARLMQPAYSANRDARWTAIEKGWW